MQLTLKSRGQEVGNIDYPNSTYLVVSKVGYLLFISFTGIVLHQIELNKLRKQSTIWE